MSSRREFLVSASALLAGAGCLDRGGSSGVETFTSHIIGSGQTLERDLTVVGLSGELPAKALIDFQAANGVAVADQYVRSDDDLELRLAAGGFGSFDVVLLGSDAIASMIGLGQLEPLVRSLLPNLDALQPPFDDSPADGGLRHSVPATYDLIGIAVSDTSPVRPLTWNAFFSQAEAYPDRVLVPDNANDVIGAVLASLGHAWDSDSSGDLDDAMQRLTELLPALRIAGRKPPPAESGHREPPIASMSSSRGFTKHQVGVEFLVPAEGTAVDVRSYCIPIYAPHPVAAHAWLNAWLRPATEAGAATELRRPVPLAQARTLMPPALVLNPAICPPLPALSKSVQPAYSDAGLARRDQIWSELLV